MVPAVVSAEAPSPLCRVCGGCHWVCENHADRPWGGLSAHPEACECGAGMPCGACHLELASAGYVDLREKQIADWLDDGGHAALAHTIRSGRHWAQLQ